MSKKVKMIIASDHAGFDLKSALIRRFADRVEWVDMGTGSSDSVHYPEFGTKAAQAIADGVAPLGVIICGSGIGISIAANRNKAVRAALCTSAEMAKLARQHNDANVLALGARIVSEDVAAECLEAFLETEFEGGRHATRVEMLGE
jgi:ribose 5-phosphate isomerase B